MQRVELHVQVALLFAALFAVFLYQKAALILASRRAAKTRRWLQQHDAKPCTVVVLGGNRARESEGARCAALLARDAKRRFGACVNVDLVLSSAHGDAARVAVNRHKCDARHVFVDLRATDTVTNFTALAADYIAAGGDEHHELRANGWLASGFAHPTDGSARRSVLVVTSSEHERRARWVAWLILECGLGVAAVFEIVLPAGSALFEQQRPRLQPEGLLLCARDVARCGCWLLGLGDLSFVGRLVHPERFFERGVGWPRRYDAGVDGE